MFDYTFLEHPYFYLSFISLHFVLGQLGATAVYKIRFGQGPLICYQSKQPNTHQKISQFLAIPVILWFGQFILYMMSSSFRAALINTPIFHIAPVWGFAVACICLVGMLYCQFAMGNAFRIGQESVSEKKQTELVKTGIYKYSRNPVYVFSTLFLWAVSTWLCTIPVFLCLVVITALIHQLVLQEEQFLSTRFGNAYREYKEEVARYF